MRLLMIGELASAGFFLSKGFIELGINVNHIAHSHSWRKDFLVNNLSSSSKYRIVRGIHRHINPLFLRDSDITGYDAVLFIDKWSFQASRMVNEIVNRKIQEKNGPSYYWLLGCDSVLREWNKINNFSLCNSCLLYDQKSTVCQTEKDTKAEEIFLSGIKKIIPGGYEYYEPYTTHNKVSEPIQMAISCDLIESRISGRRIKFIHGLNRYGFKGTQIVEKVFDSMRPQVKESDFLISKRLAISDWKNLLYSQDVAVDQLYNYSLGMNALYILSLGKLLIAGDVSRAASMFNIPNPPMIATEPSIEGLTRAIREVIDGYDLKENQEKSIQYVKNFHAPRLVAEKFIKVFGW